MKAPAQHLEFAPPPPPATGRSLGASLFVHALLLIALTAGIHWNQDTSLAVEAELWSALPQAAAPKLVEAEPPPPPPPPPAAKPVAVKPPPPAPDREADIALAKKRKQEAEQKKLQEAKEAERRRQDELKKAEDLKKAQKAAEDQKAKQKAEDDKRKLQAKRDEEQKEKERKEQEAKKQQELKDRKQAAEDAKKLEALRQDNLKRIAGLAGATGDANATGSALRSSGPSDSYGGRIRARVRPNIVFTDEVVSNVAADVEVRLAPDGTIVGRKLIKSSGNPSWDNAVLKAIDKTEVLPRDIDGRIHTPLIISFRPKD